MKKIPVIAVVGTTACGKTELGIEICKRKNAEIISADSMQIYKYLDVGTAKPSKEQLSIVKHHMIDIAEPTENYSVAKYCSMAHKAIEDVYQRGKLPVVVGGTGLYVDSLLGNIAFADAKIDLDLRENLYKRAKQEGLEKLIDEIEKKDFEYAKKLKEQASTKRVVRALEIMITTKKTVSECLKESKPQESIYDTVFIGLTYKDRKLLYDRINKRVDKMVDSGLCREAMYVMSLEDDKTAKGAIGYKEMFAYLKGEDTLENCKENLKKASRRYAKRQLTWFKRNKSINWIFVDEYLKNEQIDFKTMYEDVFRLVKDVDVK